MVDKNRVMGSAKQAKGAVKKVVGRTIGNTRLEAEGTAEEVAGKVQNAIGELTDALKGKQVAR